MKLKNIPWDTLALITAIILPALIVLSLDIDPENQTSTQALVTWAAAYLPLPLIFAAAYLIKNKTRPS